MLKKEDFNPSQSWQKSRCRDAFFIEYFSFSPDKQEQKNTTFEWSF